MSAPTVQSQAGSTQSSSRGPQSTRLHYIDWLRLIATLGVFTFHVMCVFSDTDFHIKNDVQSATITKFINFFFP